ncbi:MAG: peptidoglycan-binding domain-containing protein [Stellaceae bacterium]
MKPYFAAILALGLLASTSTYAQHAQTPQAQSDQQEPDQQSAQELSPIAPRFLKHIQARLHQEGYYDGKATGTWDDDTADAVKSFQDASGLQPTGQIDEMTIVALGLAPQQPRQLSQHQPQQQPQQQSQGSGSTAAQSGSSSPSSEMGQKEQQSLMNAYKQGFEHGFIAAMMRVQAAQGQGQGSSQPPYNWGGQQ